MELMNAWLGDSHSNLASHNQNIVHHCNLKLNSNIDVTLVSFY